MNNPVRFADPSGRFAITKALTLGAIISAAKKSAPITVPLAAAGASTAAINLANRNLNSGLATGTGFNESWSPAPTIPAAANAPTVDFARSRSTTNTRVLADVPARVPAETEMVFQFAYVNRIRDGSGQVIRSELIRMPAPRMSFNHAVLALGGAGALNASATRLRNEAGGLWGVYTPRQEHAAALANVFGAYASPRVHDSGYFGHFHDGTHSFHIWFGDPIWYSGSH